MWARNIELMLGIWILLSPLIFQQSTTDWWIHNSAIAVFVMAIALLSYLSFGEMLHYLLIPAGLWLVLSGYVLNDNTELGIVQSNVLMGWILLIFAMVPNQASSPPPDWRQTPST